MRKTKIVCTLGPATDGQGVLRQMIQAGMNVARFNFSHGTHESHREMMQRFRAVRDRLGVAAAVMLDTKGPEIRLKDMAGGEAMLADGAVDAARFLLGKPAGLYNMESILNQ